MKRHYLEYMTDVIREKWYDLALSNYGEEGNDYTYGELAEKILRLHGLFRMLGLKKGDHVALSGRNCANWAVAYLAVASYEGVVVSILQDFKAEDIKQLLIHSDAKMMFCGPYVWKDLQNEDLSFLDVVVSLTDFGFLRVKDEFSSITREKVDDEFTEAYPHGLHPENVNFFADPDKLAIINYTSGSTGNPKGVMLTGRSLSNNVEIGMDLLPVPKDCAQLVSILPLAHAFGQLADMLLPLSYGVHVYYLTKTPTPAILLKALADVRPYMVTMVPLVIEKIYKAKMAAKVTKPIVRALWKAPVIGSIVRAKVKTALQKSFGGNVRYFLLGGAALNAEVEDCLLDIHFPLTIGYGMTECGPLISGRHPRHFKARSCGSIVANMQARIENPNAEGVGEVVVKGENCMIGYYKNDEETARCFTEDGWMRTGDLGCLDKKKYIYLKGRNKTMILGASGQNIYPEDIESKLNNLPSVSESVVVEREGKLVALVFPDEQVTRRSSMEEVQELMRENLKKLNKVMPGYSQVSNIELREQPFEKTPKKSIKRFMYK